MSNQRILKNLVNLGISQNQVEKEHLERCDPPRIAIVLQTCFRALLVLVNMGEGVENG